MRPVLVAIGLALLTMQIPRAGFGTDSDSSWSAVLNYAHQKGWQFGTDIVYTYGPLGYLTSHHYSPAAPALQFITKAALGFVVALGITLVAARLNLFWRWVLIALFGLFAGATHLEGKPLRSYRPIHFHRAALLEYSMVSDNREKPSHVGSVSWDSPSPEH